MLDRAMRNPAIAALPHQSKVYKYYRGRGFNAPAPKTTRQAGMCQQLNPRLSRHSIASGYLKDYTSLPKNFKPFPSH
jgi:hypothetical protein